MHVLIVGKRGPEIKNKPRAGDLVLVTGSLGASAGGLNCLRQLGRAVMEPKREIFLPHVRPNPRVAEALALRKAGLVSGMIDLSEGLATDLNVLADREAIGAVIDESLLPISDHTERAAMLITQNKRLWALYGAEDYEILFLARPNDVVKIEKILKRNGTAFSAIGEVTAKRDGVQLRTCSGELTPFAVRGWHNLVRRSRVE